LATSLRIPERKQSLEEAVKIYFEGNIARNLRNGVRSSVTQRVGEMTRFERKK
jgi:hypothetical protein